jgi:hypothetical protein
MWFKALFRLVLMIIAPVLLLVPTLYAMDRKLDKLPWGFNYIFGCTEDGWNGTGCDPAFSRKFWRNVDGKTVQGWWPDYLGVIWEDLPWYKKWYYGYKWCAVRNVGWNLRLTDWFGTSIHFDDITVTTFEKEGHKITVEWTGPDGKSRYFKRHKHFGIYWEYGYEFHYDYFDPTHPWYNRLREEGYTFDVTPFKDRSIPSFRPRTKYKD